MTQREGLGNAEVIAVLERYGPRVLAWARRYGSSEPDDVLQDVAVRLMIYGGAYRALATELDRLGWLKTVTVRACLKRATRDARRSDVERQSQPPPLPPSCGQAGAKRLLQELWLELDAEDRAILLLYFAEGHTLSELQRDTGRSRPFLILRLRRLRRLLGRLSR